MLIRSSLPSILAAAKPASSNARSFSRLTAIRAAIAAASVLSLASAAHAADPATPDWPCIWRKVVAIDASTIWDGPALEAGSDWLKDDEIRKLSQALISRRLKLEEVEASVKKFAAAQPDDARDKKLTQLFAAVLSRTNDERKLVIGGIERFHKRQLARAKEIEKEGIVLPKEGESMPVDPMPAGEIDKLSSEEEKYKWEIRVFQERQQNIPIACEIPQLMDERAGALARAIRAEMKS